MKWQGRQGSGNIEDRRGMRLGLPVGGGIGGLVLLLLFSALTGTNPIDIINSSSPDPGSVGTTGTSSDDPQFQFLSVVLKDTEDTWSEIFRQHGNTYRPPTLVLFTDATQSACGVGQSAMGPFYCPIDQKVYLDLSFFRDLDSRFGALGDFARAYVVAHEIGHHVQTLSGLTERGCHDSDCDVCELCHEGNCGPCETGGLECCNDVCVPEDECCVHFGDECGVLITTAGGSSPPQLDCCDGLVCCETKHDSVCAECCSDHECPKGWICCAGYCREMECCIDDILAGLDPNRRCPDGCSCFEGICECHCQSNKDCAYGTCCCKDGTCAEHCCAKGCDHDKDCGYGACCCHDGSCSAHCCKKYTPPSYTPPVYTLPGTGSGDDGGGSSLAGAAAFGALAAYMAARKLRQQRSDEVAAEE